MYDTVQTGDFSTLFAEKQQQKSRDCTPVSIVYPDLRFKGYVRLISGKSSLSNVTIQPSPALLR